MSEAGQVIIMILQEDIPLNEAKSKAIQEANALVQSSSYNTLPKWPKPGFLSRLMLFADPSINNETTRQKIAINSLDQPYSFVKIDDTYIAYILGPSTKLHLYTNLLVDADILYYTKPNTSNQVAMDTLWCKYWANNVEPDWQLRNSNRLSILAPNRHEIIYAGPRVLGFTSNNQENLTIISDPLDEPTDVVSLTLDNNTAYSLDNIYCALKDSSKIFVYDPISEKIIPDESIDLGSHIKCICALDNAIWGGYSELDIVFENLPTIIALAGGDGQTLKVGIFTPIKHIKVMLDDSLQVTLGETLFATNRVYEITCEGYNVENAEIFHVAIISNKIMLTTLQGTFVFNLRLAIAQYEKESNPNNHYANILIFNIGSIQLYHHSFSYTRKFVVFDNAESDPFSQDQEICIGFIRNRICTNHKTDIVPLRTLGYWTESFDVSQHITFTDITKSEPGKVVIVGFNAEHIFIYYSSDYGRFGTWYNKIVSNRYFSLTDANNFGYENLSPTHVSMSVDDKITIGCSMHTCIYVNGQLKHEDTFRVLDNIDLDNMEPVVTNMYEHTFPA